MRGSQREGVDRANLGVRGNFSAATSSEPEFVFTMSKHSPLSGRLPGKGANPAGQTNS